MFFYDDSVLTSGILIALNSLPWAVRWVHWATPFSYATHNILTLELYYDSAKTDCLQLVSPMMAYFIDAVQNLQKIN